MGTVWGSKGFRMAPSQREKLYEGHLPVLQAKKSSVSLSLFLEINNLEIEHELACAATCFGVHAVGRGNGRMF